MNEQKFQIEYMIYAKGGLDTTDIDTLNSKLNRSIFSPTKNKYPIEMLYLLSTIYKVPPPLAGGG